MDDDRITTSTLRSKARHLCQRTVFFTLTLVVLVWIPQAAMAARKVTAVNVQPDQVAINQEADVVVEGKGSCDFNLDKD